MRGIKSTLNFLVVSTLLLIRKKNKNKNEKNFQIDVWKSVSSIQIVKRMKFKIAGTAGLMNVQNVQADVVN